MKSITSPLRLHRRDYLAGVAGAAALHAIPRQAFATFPSQSKTGAIDAHVHVWPTFGAQYPLASGFSAKDVEPSSFTPQQLFDHCRPAGVDRIVLIQMNFFGFDNSYMLACMSEHPGTFSGVAVIDHTQPDVAQTMRNLREKGVRGYRLYATAENVKQWQKDLGIAAMFQCGAETGQAMCMLSDPEAIPGIDALCQRFPDTPVVIDHFSRIGMRGPIEPSEVDRLCRLARYPRTYVKTSAFYALGQKTPPFKDLGSLIRRLRDEFGANRLMWASDCPYQVQPPHTYLASLSLIREHLDFLSDDDRNAILRATAENVFFG